MSNAVMITLEDDAERPAAPRRGRPRSEQPCTSVSTWVPTPYHDRLIKMANQRGMTVSSLVKQIIVIQLRGGLSR